MLSTDFHTTLTVCPCLPRRCLFHTALPTRGDALWQRRDVQRTMTTIEMILVIACLGTREEKWYRFRFWFWLDFESMPFAEEGNGKFHSWMKVLGKLAILDSALYGICSQECKNDENYSPCLIRFCLCLNLLGKSRGIQDSKWRVCNLLCSPVSMTGAGYPGHVINWGRQLSVGLYLARERMPVNTAVIRVQGLMDDINIQLMNFTMVG